MKYFNRLKNIKIRPSDKTLLYFSFIFIGISLIIFTILIFNLYP